MWISNDHKVYLVEKYWEVSETHTVKIAAFSDKYLNTTLTRLPVTHTVCWLVENLEGFSSVINLKMKNLHD